jgi:carboxyl-terminal processing protease
LGARRHSTLILDLRENPGGLVDAAKRMISNLFDHDVKVFDRMTRHGRSTVVAKSRGTSAYSGKLIVLIDSGSASSAEILARVVQLEKRGTVMGDRSAGAVMETQFLSFAQGGETAIFYSVAVTDADLVMTDGKSLEAAGVKPDELSLPTPLDLAAGRDPVLAQAARLAGLSLDPVAAGKLFPFEWRPF